MVQTAKTCEKGFTLIEVLVAVVILSFISIASFSFMTNAYENETKSIARIKALQLAFSCSEYLQSLDFDAISENSCDFLEADNTFRNFNISFNINILQKDVIPNEVKLVDVIVKWSLYGKNNEYVLKMLVNNDV